MRFQILAFASAIGAILASHSTASPINCWMQETKCHEYVGKRLWVYIPRGNPNVVEATLTRGDWTTALTIKLKTGASFLVTGIDQVGAGSADHVVSLHDGRKAWIRSSSPFIIDYDPIARAKAARDECARRGQPRIGMSRDELVETCWRKPLRIVKKTTSAGVEESYIYGFGHVVRLIDGKVAEIIESQ